MIKFSISKLFYRFVEQKQIIMTTANVKLEQKIKSDFTAYFGYEPKGIKIDGGIAYVDGYYCIIINNKSIKKTHGIAWRIDPVN